MKKTIKNVLVLSIALSGTLGVLTTSCSKSQEENYVQNQNQKSVEFVSQATIDAENKALIIGAIELHTTMLETNANATVTFKKNDDGRVEATFDGNGNADPETDGREQLCKGATTAEMADCMDGYLSKGICLVIAQCAVCAYEGPCPTDGANP